MKLYLGHDEYNDRDYLLTIHDTGELEIATRPGLREGWTTWSAPTALLPQSEQVTQ